ncbi:hypothetical protein M422DRAFT_80923, partial [Sphaerobolus stellatus SS14]
DEDELPAPLLSNLYLNMLQQLHSSRYLKQWVSIPKTHEQLWLTLNVYKMEHPELFRSYLRISPATFDALVQTIQLHPVFRNQSYQEQIPVNQQLAIALYRFGHYGNAASVQKVGLWAGFGYGTVDLCTKRVMTAVCDAGFRCVVMQWPNAKQKEDAKVWVESQTCPSWCDGWLMVDGTLVPLFAHPGFYGNSWYDQKSNYSLNVQLISTPNLRIIDYGVGLPGSQHDTTAWKETRMVNPARNRFQRDGEWVWADTAYPLQTWCQAPYKK